MMDLPESIAGVIDFSGEELKLKPGATPEQQKAFKKFIKQYKEEGGCFKIEI
ncbi:MAG: hypothetical protein LKG31_00915 [Lactobacillus sp.]|jgi:hypothetical protein|nr:hypothetical protein [Lactobacillus sp.]